MFILDDIILGEEIRFFVCKVIGDGDCLFNFVLCIVVGNEFLCYLFCLLIIFEFYFYSNFYVKYFVF